MRNVILFVVIVFIASYADGKVYYLENLAEARNNDAIYPIVEPQASRDLDLAFSAGDPVENENVVSPAKKVFTLVAPDKPYVELNRDTNRPIAYYRLTESSPIRRGNLDDVILVPQGNGNRKLMKLNGNDKGEVILELRVIANHDST
ncbi:uncharacterized protein LOC114943127 [Nylanderia fulva]|uniref:uncharacterized protein LOC114943127 n=1 Tax=Nylanderia fulva TaxID=613905 RepID=UPI0010FB0DA7|nr:uncharacterized protein LOC114943127 [Nylanderia fulva]